MIAAYWNGTMLRYYRGADGPMPVFYELRGGAYVVCCANQKVFALRVESNRNIFR